MSSILSNLSFITFGMVGNWSSQFLLGKVINPSCDWKGKQEDQPTTDKKIYLLGIKIFLSIATGLMGTKIIQQGPSFFKARHIPYSSVLSGFCFGFLAGIGGVFNNSLTKLMNGNFTPNPAHRQNYLSVLDLINFPILLFGPFVGCSLPVIGGINSLVGDLGVFVYDLNDANSQKIDRIVMSYFPPTIE